MEIKVITYEESRLEFFKKELKMAQNKLERIKRTCNRNESPLSEKSLMLDDAGAEVSYYRDIVKMLEDNVKNNHKKATTVANPDTPTTSCENCAKKSSCKLQNKVNFSQSMPKMIVCDEFSPTETDFKYFTAEQVRNMSQKEVKENYSDIMKSMKKWGEENAKL